jgi:radical SAM protein with 4Fe4S-binding SPASM domain
MKRDPKFMSVLEFQTVLKKIKPHTDYVYLHLKGEPLLHPELESILWEAKQAKMQVNLTTNGILLWEKAGLLLNSPCLRQVNISLHALGELPDDRRPNYLTAVADLIKEVTKNRKFYVSLRFWLGNNPLKSFAISFLEETLEIKIPDENAEILPNIFLSLDEVFVWPEEETRTSPFRGCHGIKDHLGILADGTVVPCCLDGNGKIPLGNIFQNSLEEILETSRYRELQKSFATRKNPEILCQHCSYKDRFTI